VTKRSLIWCVEKVFPYDYEDGLEKLKKEKLPPKETFYSRLYDENISDKD